MSKKKKNISVDDIQFGFLKKLVEDFILSDNASGNDNKVAAYAKQKKYDESSISFAELLKREVSADLYRSMEGLPIINTSNGRRKIDKLSSFRDEFSLTKSSKTKYMALAANSFLLEHGILEMSFDDFANICMSLLQSCCSNILFCCSYNSFLSFNSFISYNGPSLEGSVVKRYEIDDRKHTFSSPRTFIINCFDICIEDLCRAFGISFLKLKSSNSVNSYRKEFLFDKKDVTMFVDESNIILENTLNFLKDSGKNILPFVSFERQFHRSSVTNNGDNKLLCQITTHNSLWNALLCPTIN